MDSYTKEFCDNTLPTEQPNTFAACYPRRITPPGSHVNPKYYASVLYCELIQAIDDEAKMRAHVTGVLNCMKQLELGVPTYFVKDEFVQAVAQTNPPKDMLLGEIKWPLDAMLFVLPTNFALRYFGYMMPFISVTRSQPGIYPDCVKLPKLDIHPSRFVAMNSHVERFNVVGPCFSRTGVPVDYTATFNMKHQISALEEATIEDSTYYDDERLHLEREHVADLPQGENEPLIHRKLVMLAVKLMLALTAEPTFIQNGQMTRKPGQTKGKHPRPIDALWSPNTVGWSYRAERPASTPQGGTHSSPRMHWRRGHMTNQAYGEGRTLRKLIWIKPILINAPA